MGKNLKVTKKLWLCLLVQIIAITSVVAQNYRVSGKVTDAETGEPLDFVTVVEKGTNRSTITDLKGDYILNVADVNSVVIFQYVGYNRLEVTVTGPTLNVALKPDVMALDEVVVVAYGTQRRSSITGSVGTVKSEDIMKLQSTSVTQSLQGMSPGVQVLNNIGAPGAEGNIFIRGLGSYSASNSPLYVVDGVPATSGLNMLAPSDIENITILKDAASTALYGSRAANGVLMITTKKGNVGKPVVNFSSKWSTNDFAVSLPERMAPGRLLELSWEGYYLDAKLGIGMTARDENAARAYASSNAMRPFYKTFSNANETYYISIFKNADGSHCNEPVGTDGKLKNGLVNVFEEEGDWSQMFKQALRQEYSLDVSGATDNGKMRYFISGSYLDDKGHYLTQRFKRYTARANVSTEVNKWLELGLNLGYAHTGRNESTYTAGVRVARIMPTLWSP